MIPISQPDIQEDEINAVIDVLKSGIIVQGEKTQELEQLFTKICGTKYAVAVNSGTAALHTALYAAGIGPGDEVITSPFTFGATANSILMVGAKSIFVDITLDSYNIDASKIEEAITPNTKAILPINLYGQAADYSKIQTIAKKHKLLIIEDAAQSVGSKYDVRASGNLGDIGCLSLYATKNIMCGEGGMITTNDKEYFDRAKLFRNHGQPENEKYNYLDLGFNYRLTDIAAAIGIEQVKKLSQYTSRRQSIAKKYSESFNDVPGIITPIIKSNRTHVFHQYTIFVTDEFKLSRDELQKYLFEKNIQTNVYYPKPLNKFDQFLSSGTFTNATKAAKRVLSLPVHPQLTDDDVNYIISTFLHI